jgi:hypothetical protein
MMLWGMITPPVHAYSVSDTGRPRALAPVMHTTMVAVDIVAFCDRYHGASMQLRARQQMYELLMAAFAITGLPWRDCYREDRGDGALIVASPDSSPDGFLDPLAYRLNALLSASNRRAANAAPLQLRIAVHHGRVYSDAHGITSPAVIHMFRLLDAPAFKKSLRIAGADLGMIVSAQLFTDAKRRDGLVDQDAYHLLHIRNKETRSRAWLWLPR